MFPNFQDMKDMARNLGGEVGTTIACEPTRHEKRIPSSATTSTIDTSACVEDESELDELDDTVSELPETPLSMRRRFPSSPFSTINPELQSLEVAFEQCQKSPKAGLEVKLNELDFKELLQPGNHGDVIRAKWTRKTCGQASVSFPINVAVKMLHAGIEVQNVWSDTLTPHHQNIARSFDVGNVKHLRVTEYYAGGSLLDLMAKRVQLSWKQKVKILLDIGLGMEELHANGIIHGRLKSSNVLIDEKLQRTPAGPTKELIAKVSDFGFVLVRKTAYGIEGVEDAKAWYYNAPEVNAGFAPNYQADVFSFGVVMSEVLTGHEACSAQLLSFMQQCLSQEPSQRPQFTEAVQFLKNQSALLEMYEKLKGMKI